MAHSSQSTSATTPTRSHHHAPLVWVDCEMTGLDRTTDALVEIAVLVTDSELTILDEEGLDIVIHASDEVLDAMDPYVENMHTKNGLINEIRSSTTTVEEAEAQVMEYLQRFITTPGRALLAGNSISQDRAFIIRDMPTLDAFLHYRMIDVSTVKELCQRWYPTVSCHLPRKGSSHRAMDDIRDSINELQYYREHAFVPSPGPSNEEMLQRLTRD